MPPVTAVDRPPRRHAAGEQDAPARGPFQVRAKEGVRRGQFVGRQGVPQREGAYGWDEAETRALGDSRRAAYLSRLD